MANGSAAPAARTGRIVSRLFSRLSSEALPASVVPSFLIDYEAVIVHDDKPPQRFWSIPATRWSRVARSPRIPARRDGGLCEMEQIRSSPRDGGGGLAVAARNLGWGNGGDQGDCVDR